LTPKSDVRLEFVVSAWMVRLEDLPSCRCLQHARRRLSRSRLSFAQVACCLVCLDVFEALLLVLQFTCLFEDRREDLGNIADMLIFVSVFGKWMLDGFFIIKTRLFVRNMLATRVITKPFLVLVSIASLGSVGCPEQLYYMALQSFGMAVMATLYVHVRDRLHQRRPRLRERDAQKMPVVPPVDLEHCSRVLEDGALVGDCAICLESMVAGEVVAALPCSHTLHKACLEAWFKHSPTCPLRCKLVPVQEQEQAEDAALHHLSPTLLDLAALVEQEQDLEWEPQVTAGQA